MTAKTRPAPDGPELAAYLRHFRADSIVDDAEHIRRSLGIERWSTLGQSYGGFVTLTYLSKAPRVPARPCYVTGGLPGLHADADEVYRRTYRRVEDKLRRYFARYPDDRARLDGLLSFLDGNDIRLPDGDRLTPQRVKFLGMELGTGSGAESLHWLLTEAWTGGELSDEFLYQVMAETSFAGNPLYAIMHESIYSQGAPTNWAAARLAPDLPLTGEMIYPWMFDEIRALRPFRETAECPPDDLARPVRPSPAWPPTRCRSERSSTTTTCMWTRACQRRRHARWPTDDVGHERMGARRAAGLGRDGHPEGDGFDPGQMSR